MQIQSLTNRPAFWPYSPSRRPYAAFIPFFFIASVPDHSFDAFDGSLHPSAANISPIVNFSVGDGSRFAKGSQASNYLGFVPRLDYSGTIQRHGHIAKRGNGYLRGLLVQAAWSTVRSKKGGALRGMYLYKTSEKGLSKKKTIVAVGRR